MSTQVRQPAAALQWRRGREGGGGGARRRLLGDFWQAIARIAATSPREASHRPSAPLVERLRANARFRRLRVPLTTSLGEASRERGRMCCKGRLAAAVATAPAARIAFSWHAWTPASGRQIGRYLLFGEIASGGMATVHFGRLSGPAGFSRTVAIKRLHPQFAKDPDFVSMFLDEARLAARIRHPNVVPDARRGVDRRRDLPRHGVRAGRVARAPAPRGASDDDARRHARRRDDHVAASLHGLHAAHEAQERAGRAARHRAPRRVAAERARGHRRRATGARLRRGEGGRPRCRRRARGRSRASSSYMAPEQLHGAHGDATDGRVRGRRGHVGGADRASRLFRGTTRRLS